MVGDIHEAANWIKTRPGAHVMLRHEGQYKVLKARSPEGMEALDFATVETLVGVFQRSVPIHVIYESAGEQTPADLAA